MPHLISGPSGSLSPSCGSCTFHGVWFSSEGFRLVRQSVYALLQLGNHVARISLISREGDGFSLFVVGVSKDVQVFDLQSVEIQVP